MKIKYLPIILISLFFCKAGAQEKTTSNLPNLSVGDQLPDFSIDKLINTTKKSISTSTFKHQLLIIDFWSINCSGCVAALPKMQNLQKQYGAKLTILPVTYEKEAEVIAFWKNNKYTKNLTLSSVVEDKVFENYFRHKTIPHEVWIYKGKIIGITGPDFVDAANIEKVLSGTPVNWPVKNDFYAYDFSKPLFIPDPAQLDQDGIISYAAISDYKEGVNSEGLTGGSGIVRDPVKKTVRAFFLNQPIFTAYLLAWMKVGNISALPHSGDLINPANAIWEVGDKHKYVFDPKLAYQQEWLRDYAICFESLNPDTGQTDIAVQKSIISDLNRLLGLNVRLEKRQEGTESVYRLVFSEVNGGFVYDAKQINALTAKRASQKDMKGPTPEEDMAFLAENKKKSGVITLPSGLQYKILKSGSGIKPAITDKVITHYTGTLANGKLFDSSYERGAPAAFKVNDVIKGWTEALQLMPEGAKWMLYIPAELAYGTHTAQGTVPPDSVLVFELELLKVSRSRGK